MSKKVAAEVLRLFGSGEIARAEELAGSIEAHFLKRRLELALEGPLQTTARAALIHFGHQPLTQGLPPAPPPHSPGKTDPTASTGASDQHVEPGGTQNQQSAESSTGTRQEDLAGSGWIEVDLPSDVLLSHPEGFLRALPNSHSGVVRFDKLHFVQPWALVALATLGRHEQRNHLVLESSHNAPGKFAHALGVFNVAEGRETVWQGEQGRTVRLRRFRTFEEIEPTASSISKLVLPDPAHDDSRRAVYYVLVELLRNVVQHSHDPLGGVVAAQLMDEHQRYPRPTVQVCVADSGRGVFAALRNSHPKLVGPEEALEKSLWPHYSGTFEEGRTGAGQNAGLGLFFISEMAKLASGRLLLASRDAALLLQGGAIEADRQRPLEIVKPSGTGFPGTLVTFELPIGSVEDYEGLIHSIQERARVRTPQRVIHHWVRFVDSAPSDSLRVLVQVGAEDTVAASDLSEKLVLRVFRKEPVALDFSGLDICTQSYLHALLFETVRTAWARQTPLYVIGARPGVRSGIELLENYALGG